MSKKQNQQNYNRTGTYKNIEADLYMTDNLSIPPRKKKNNLKMLASFLFLLTVIAAFLIAFYENAQKANTDPEKSGSNKINIMDTNTEKQPGTNNSTSNFTVVIDAGHGGFDTGKESTDGKNNEDVLNLAVVKKLGTALQKLGITPIYTRNDNNALGLTKEEDMQKRVDITNQSGADLFVSIHMNSFPEDTSVSGPEVYYYDSGSSVSKSSKSFAELMQQELNTFTGKNRTFRHEDLMVTRESNIPAILIECGFLSNQYDEEKLNNSEYQTQLADIIANCIKNYSS